MGRRQRRVPPTRPAIAEVDRHDGVTLSAAVSKPTFVGMPSLAMNICEAVKDLANVTR